MRLRVSFVFHVFLSSFFKMCLNVFECVCDSLWCFRGLCQGRGVPWVTLGNVG